MTSHTHTHAGSNLSEVPHRSWKLSLIRPAGHRVIKWVWKLVRQRWGHYSSGSAASSAREVIFPVKPTAGVGGKTQLPACRHRWRRWTWSTEALQTARSRQVSQTLSSAEFLAKRFCHRKSKSSRESAMCEKASVKSKKKGAVLSDNSASKWIEAFEATLSSSFPKMSNVSWAKCVMKATQTCWCSRV